MSPKATRYTRDVLARRRARLLKRSPHLADADIVVCGLADAPLDEIGTFIESTWIAEYGEAVRLTFCPDFLRFHVREGEPGMVTIARIGGALCGVVLAYPLAFCHGDTPLDGIIATGLCTSPEQRHTGLSDLILLEQGLALAETGYPFSIHWRRSEVGSRARAIPTYAKALDVARAARLGKIGWPLRLGASALNLLFRPGMRLPRRFAMVPCSELNLTDCAAFLREFQPEGPVTRAFPHSELAQRFVYTSGKVSSVAWAAVEGKTIRAILFGYTNPVMQGEAYCAVDGIVFHPDLSYLARRAILSRYEKIARDTYGCFSIAVTGSVCAEDLRRHGYLAIRQHALGIIPYDDRLPAGTGDASILFTELR